MADVERTFTLDFEESCGFFGLKTRTIKRAFIGCDTIWRNAETGQMVGSCIALRLEGLAWKADRDMANGGSNGARNAKA